MNGGSGKYVQDNHAGNNERKTLDSGPIKRLPRKSQATSDMSTTPAPDQTAYAIPTDRVRKARERKKKATA